MKTHNKSIAVVQGAPSAVIQRLFSDLVERWRSEIRIVGMLEGGHGPKFKARDVGLLKSIVDGRSFPIFQNWDPARKVAASIQKARQRQGTPSVAI